MNARFKLPTTRRLKLAALLALAGLCTPPAAAGDVYLYGMWMNVPGNYILNGHNVFSPFLGTAEQRTMGDLSQGTLNFCQTHVIGRRCVRSGGDGYLQSGTISVNLVNASTFYIGGDSAAQLYLQGAISHNEGNALRLEIGGARTGAAGTVKINTNQVFSELHVLNGRLDLNGAGAISANNMRLNAVTGTLLNQRGSASFAGGVSLETAGQAQGLVNIGGLADLGLAGVVSGDAGLNKVGAGTLLLSGNNSYSGATLVSAGTLVQRGDSKSSAYSVAAGATLDLNIAGGMRSYSAGTRFSGDGTLRKSGDGLAVWEGSKATFAMSAASLIDVQGGTLSGGSYGNEDWSQNQARLNVAAGALFMGVEAKVRVDALSGAGTIASGYGQNQGSVSFGVANGSGHFSGTLRDTDPDGINWGGFIKEGSGTQILTGDTALYGYMRIHGGTLQIGDGGSRGSLSAFIVNNAQLSMMRSDNYRFDSVVRGTGSFSQLGSGTLTLAAAMEYSGNTTISRGTLALDGPGRLPEASTVYLDQGGSLELRGRVQRVQGLGSAAQPMAGNLLGGRLISAKNAFYIKSGTVTAALDGAHADARLWIGGDANASVLLDGRNDMVYTPDHHQVIIGHEHTGAAGVVKLGNANALAAASEQVQVFAGTLDLNGVAGVSGASIQLLGGATSSLINGRAGSVAQFGGAVGLTFQQASQLGGAGDLWLSGAITGEGSGINKIGGGTLTLAGSSSHSGATVVDAGTLAAGRAGSLSAASTVYINNGAALRLGGFSQTVAGLGDARRPVVGNLLNGRLLTSAGGVFIQSGVVAATLAGTHAGARLWIGGDASASVLLAGANEMVYSPDHNQVIIGHESTGAAGVVKLGNANALAAASENVQLFAGTLDLNGVSNVRAKSILLLGGSGINNALINGKAGSSASFAGPVIAYYEHSSGLGGDGNLQLSGPLIGNGLPLRKIGLGTLTLTGDNSYTGGMAIDQGQLDILSAKQLGSGPLSFGGGTLRNWGAINTDRAITLNAGGAHFAPQAMLDLSGRISGSGDLSLGAGGRMLLSGNNDGHSGDTHVQAGAQLTVQGSHANSRFSVAQAGEIGGTGTLGGLALAGLLAPGAVGEAGTLSVKGNASFAGGASYRWELAAQNHDSLHIGGTLSLDGSVNAPITIGLRALLGGATSGFFDPRQDHHYTLAYAEGGLLGFTSDEFRIEAGGFGLDLYGGKWSLSASGQALVLNYSAAVPEPAGYALMLAGLLALALARLARRPRLSQ